MAELIGGSGYDDVQDTAPSSPSIGDTWLDTSTDPPQGKIYADLGSGGQWTAEDVAVDVWSDGQKHGPSDLKASAVDWSSKTSSFLSLPVQGTKQTGIDTSTAGSSSTTATLISGSGFFVGENINCQIKVWNNSNSYHACMDYIDFELLVDGSVTISRRLDSPSDGYYDSSNTFSKSISYPLFSYFSNSLELRVTVNWGTSGSSCGSTDADIQATATQASGPVGVLLD